MNNHAAQGELARRSFSEGESTSPAAFVFGICSIGLKFEWEVR